MKLAMSIIRVFDSALVLGFLSGSFLYALAVTPAAEAACLGAPVGHGPGDQANLVMAPDGQGGVYIAWTHLDFVGLSFGIVVQRLDAQGAPIWSAGSVSIPSYDAYLTLAPDGTGGVFLVWRLQESSPVPIDEIRALRLDSNGQPATDWPIGGVSVCSLGTALRASASPDGQGGLFVVWEDNRNSSTSDFDIYAQRISPVGMKVWPSSGVPVFVGVGHQELAKVVPDGSGGALVTWDDFVTYFAPPGYAGKVVVQKLGADGALPWGAGGVALRTGTRGCYGTRIVTDAAGGALVVWTDAPNDTITTVRAGRVTDAGIPTWGAAGVLLSGTSMRAFAAALVADEAGGGYCTWTDGGSYSRAGVMAQHLDVSGASAWSPGGLLVGGGALSTENARRPALTRVSGGDLVVAWDTADSMYVDEAMTLGGDLWVQRLTPSGQVAPGWSFGGNRVCDAPFTQGRARLITTSSGALVGWMDGRDGVEYEIHAGLVPGTTASIGADDAGRGRGLRLDHSGVTRVGGELVVDCPRAGRLSLVAFDITGRRVRTLVESAHSPQGRRAVTWDGLGDAGERLSSGVYLLRLTLDDEWRRARIIFLK